MKPLQNLTILDLSRVLACPFASMILAELGATVIKVEEPGRGDETRTFEPFVTRDGGRESAYYLAFNRSKRSITVDLRSREGQEIVRGLAAEADVLLENFPVGTLARHGLDYASIRAVNERIVYVSCTGFGQTGPYARRKGYDTIFQAMGGIMSLTGERGGDPVKPGLPVADLSSGLWIVIAVLAAVQGRDAAGGTGSHVDFSMLDGQIALLTLAAARWFALGEVPPRLGTEHPSRVPTASFRCADGGWLHITASDQHWMPLCRVLGLETWGGEPALQQNSERVRRRDEVMAALGGAIATRRRDELAAALDAAGVPQGPIRTVDEILADEHTRARALVDTFEHPVVGSFPGLRLPYRFDGFDDPAVGRPPLLGEHTDEILRERLGYSAERIAALREAKVV
ncbi:CaiB/BaiF CoA-transferase family protein [Rhodoplanes sp. TEM]|uniref:CaiB/BaiF CoA-transferase family protein n=1 Tax=Rhodoplanes tepidamans TaxID=200616 RepID=A0ABT5J349_RHOTP|nr:MULTISPECIES: CaiB/BaiF CoA-transferase family protein [Rhodoplanes]MDC7784107.1 CaiB/BaiF CoA-transferase family protein [Rhodoplanes tepidamans]MDC7983202.1 CaiB/BaiF CoA-transferase family protein [Rhodoplanes sp. TEM]MDQ0356796.1 crotonobetainyl-CoA:carnitine CoA-transferase CaiB-like acyl-CoA transferase [Rhodoplanes tepidamans]